MRVHGPTAHELAMNELVSVTPTYLIELVRNF